MCLKLYSGGWYLCPFPKSHTPLRVQILAYYFWYIQNIRTDSLSINLASIHRQYAQYWGVEFPTRGRGQVNQELYLVGYVLHYISHPPDLRRNVSGSSIISFPPLHPPLPYPTLPLLLILPSPSSPPPPLLHAPPLSPGYPGWATPTTVWIGIHNIIYAL